LTRLLARIAVAVDVHDAHDIAAAAVLPSSGFRGTKAASFRAVIRVSGGDHAHCPHGIGRSDRRNEKMTTRGFRNGEHA
jgi:hypothetical protein